MYFEGDLHEQITLKIYFAYIPHFIKSVLKYKII